MLNDMDATDCFVQVDSIQNLEGVAQIRNVLIVPMHRILVLQNAAVAEVQERHLLYLLQSYFCCSSVL